MNSRILIHIKLFIIYLFFAGICIPAYASDEVEILFPFFNDETDWEDQYFYSTIIEIDDDFFADITNNHVIEVTGTFGKHNVSLAYYGDGTNKDNSNQNLSTEHSFNQLSLSENKERSYFDLIYQYDLLNMENKVADISVGFIGKMKFTDDIIKIENLNFDLTDNTEKRIFLPGLNLNFGFPDQKLNFNLIGSGIENKDLMLYQGQAIISFKPTPYLNIQGGYRLLYIDLNKNNEKTTSDSYLGITLNF